MNVTFRLLQTVLDHNYLQKDHWGQKHVFEFCCRGGNRWHLHFHQGGDMDKLQCFSALPAGLTSLWLAPSSSAVRPAVELNPPWTFEYIVAITADSPAKKVERREAQMALDTFLEAYHPARAGGTGAVDITNNAVFNWARFLRNVNTRQEIIGTGICKVFAVREFAEAPARIVFCHPEDTVTNVKVLPRVSHWSEGCSWYTEPLFANASIAAMSWLELRGRIFAPR